MRKVAAGAVVIGLALAACPDQSADTGDAAADAPFESVELAVTGPAGLLAGTLTTPASGCPCPTAILIPGVGAHDRDYTLWGLPRFRVLAEHLARHGIASLRYDERGVGASTANPAGATSADFAADVRAWIDALRARAAGPDPAGAGPAGAPDPGHGPAVDPDRIGLIGHSEGGTVAGLAAAGADDVAFVVLLASPGLSGREYNLQYEASMARAAGAGEAAIAERRAFQARVLDAVLEACDSADAARRLRAIYGEATPDVPPDRLERGIRRLTSPWFRFSVAHDPARTLRAVDAPVLAVFGERDRQVPPEGNLEAMAAVVGAGEVGAGESRVVVLPGLNHFLQPAETGAAAEYPGIEEAWAPALLDLVTGWIRANAGAQPARSCTVLHVSGDGYVLGGSNEDWSDPATRFWLIPAADGRHGWIKFGFAGGFPQGGMNDEGLFWDATGVPYLAMPVSEANKRRYEGPLMEKVITEAGTVAEARAILDDWYCDDQYRALYLVGDAAGESMVVEGDTILAGTGAWQVAPTSGHPNPGWAATPARGTRPPSRSWPAPIR
ncbi:MAG: CocE/NonD family hydrolase [Candidatus Longimicrobiales bacterium M2_2A_002]